MPHEDPNVNPLVAPALTDQDPQTIQTPSIGETIDDEGPGKAKQFFTDPKNLATMLVLASALAQPKRGGRSNVAHALRAGTGALAFRGGLNQQIDIQQQAGAEAASVVQDRTAQQRLSGERTGVLESQVGATTRGQDIQATQAGLDRTSEEKIAQGRIDVLSSRAILENELIKIGVEGYHKAYSDWLLAGGVGTPPDPRAMIPLPEGMSIGPLNSDAEIIIPGDELTTALAEPEDRVKDAERAPAVPFAPTLISGVPVAGDLARGLRKDLPAERVKAVQLRVARKKFPDAFKDSTDDEIFSTISSIQADIKARLDAGMSQEEAIKLKKDTFMLNTMTREQRKEVLRLARGPIKIPKATSF